MRIFVLQLLAVSCWIGLSRQASLDVALDLEKGWIDFKEKYNKIYRSEKEEDERRLIWEDNLDFIEQHNEMESKGYHTFTLKMNKYGDMQNSEFNRILNNLNTEEIVEQHSPINSQIPNAYINVEVPEAINWEKRGYVTSVKDQKSCSLGWAFAAMASVEAQYRNLTSELKQFSEQILLDCPYNQNISNCEGGTIIEAFMDINWNAGAFSDDSHPYLGTKQTCDFDDTNNLNKFFVVEYQEIQSSNETALTRLVGTAGPVAAYINAHERTFQFYEKGVYSSDSCDSSKINHAVTIVGYDSLKQDTDSLEYYIIKNSYGTEWGMDGYMQLARNKNNMCGIAFQAYLPSLFLLTN